MFTTDRIYLRKVQKEDAGIYYVWRNNTDVMENTSPHLDVHSMKDTEEFIDSIRNSTNSKSYIINNKATNESIGIISLINIDYKNRNAECIIDIGNQDYWGKGIGKEAMKLLLDYSFLELNLHKLYLKVFTFNKRAIKLYKKLGFEIEGEQKEQIFRNGNWHGVFLMGIFQANYHRDTIEY